MLSGLINTKSTLPLDQIRLDGGTQPRAGLDESHVADLVEAVEAGASLPPIDVMHDGENYWCFDGFHRVACARKRGENAIAVRVHQGSQFDAQWASYAVNKAHGLKRSNDDKRRAIVAALKHPHGASRSDHDIARHVGVDHTTVGEWRKKLESTGGIPQSEIRRGGDGRAINTAKIGAKAADVEQYATMEQIEQAIEWYARDAKWTAADLATAALAYETEPHFKAILAIRPGHEYGKVTRSDLKMAIRNVQKRWAQVAATPQPPPDVPMLPQRPEPAALDALPVVATVTAPVGQPLEEPDEPQPWGIDEFRANLYQMPGASQRPETTVTHDEAHRVAVVPRPRWDRLAALRGQYQLCLLTMTEFGELTGRHTETLAVERGLARLIELIDHELAPMASATTEEQ